MPVYQEWGPSPEVLTIYKSINISAPVAPRLETIKVMDVIGRFPQYSDFRIIYSKMYNGGPNGTAYIKPFSYDGIAIPNFNGIIPITTNGVVLQYPLQLINQSNLVVGTYTFRQQFFLIGKKVGTVDEEQISYLIHNTIVKVVNDVVLRDPSEIIIDHIIGTTLPSRQIAISGNIWRLVGNPKFILSSIDPNVFIETTNGPDGTYQIAFGNQASMVKVTLTNHFNIAEAEPYQYSYDSLAIMVGSEVKSTLAIRVKKSSTQILIVSPLEISFQAIKNTTEAVAKNVVFQCNVAYVIQSSEWITTNVETIAIDGIPTQIIKVVPIPSASMDAGIYVGFVKVTGTVNGVSTERKIKVDYIITDIAQFPYNPNKLAFTLDNKFIKIETFNTGTYMQMDTVVQAFNFYTDEMTEYVIQEKIGLFKGKANVNIGKVIHQILNKNKVVNENTLQYKPALVRIIFNENNLSDDTTIRSDSSGELKFIAGLSLGFESFGFLKINHLAERVTKKSFKFLNIFTPSGIHNLLLYKNGVLFSETELPPSGGRVLTLKENFAQFTEGDKIEYQLKSISQINEITSRSQLSTKIAFVLFPEGMYSNTIIWEDEFLLKQSMECTGTHSIKSSLSFISQKKYINLVEHLTHLESNKVSKLTINTGWLMQSDVDTVESLMRSKKVWLTANGKKIFMVPTSDSINNSDSERELVDYTIEFQINPSYNEETYSL